MKKIITPKEAALQLTAFFKRNGYVRKQNTERLLVEGAQLYKKYDEVRLTANSEEELTLIQELLETLEFKSGRPFAQSLRFRIPLYGREQIARFLEVVGHNN